MYCKKWKQNCLAKGENANKKQKNVGEKEKTQKCVAKG